MARPTNRAGGLEGGVTNGEELRVTGYMKPISTLMKPLRSVDSTTLEEAPAAIERSDVCAVPAAAVVGEAMVCLVLADAVLERFGGDSMRQVNAHYRETTGRARRRLTRRARRSRDTLMLRPIVRYGADALHQPPATSRPSPPTSRQLIDDMVETMYAAPGIGLAAPQVGVPLRSSSSICRSAAIRRRSSR